MVHMETSRVGLYMETLGLGLDSGGAVHMETSCGVILGILDGVRVPPLAPRLPRLPLAASYSQGQG